MAGETRIKDEETPRSGESLVPMLVWSLALTGTGLLVVVAFA